MSRKPHCSTNPIIIQKSFKLQSVTSKAIHETHTITFPSNSRTSSKKDHPRRSKNNLLPRNPLATHTWVSPRARGIERAHVNYAQPIGLLPLAIPGDDFYHSASYTQLCYTARDKRRRLSTCERRTARDDERVSLLALARVALKFLSTARV